MSTSTPGRFGRGAYAELMERVRDRAAELAREYGERVLDPANRDSYSFAIAREFEPVDESDYTNQLRAAIADYPPYMRYQRMSRVEREEASMWSDLDVLNRALLELLEQGAGQELGALNGDLARARAANDAATIERIIGAAPSPEISALLDRLEKRP